MNKSVKTPVISILLMSVFLANCGDGNVVEDLKIENNKFFFTLTDIDGNVKKFEDLRGKGVVINAWATWCGPCIKEMPIINDLYNKYKDQGLEIWGLATDIQGTSIVRPKLEELGIDYPNFVYLQSDLNGIFEYIRGLPTTLFFDETGEVVLRQDGEPFVNQNEGETLESWWEENIKAILPKK